MPIKEFDIAFKHPERWKRAEAISAVKQMEFGLEALPVVQKGLDDEADKA
jgi:hypothetical protein